LNRLVPNGMPGGVRGGRNFPLLDCKKGKIVSYFQRMKPFMKPETIIM